MFKTGTRLSLGSLVLRFAPSPDGVNRVSYLIRKKSLKLAVHRNLVRRQLREAFRVHQNELEMPLWLIFDYQPHPKNQVESGLYVRAIDLIKKANLKSLKKWKTKE